MLTDSQILGIDTTHLCPLSEFPVQGVSANYALSFEAATAFVKMQQAAANDGVDCQIISGHRDFSTQLRIWQRKWRGESPIVDDTETPIDTAELSNTQKMHAILRFSALPGASRHHWGTDIDLYDAKTSMEAKHSMQLVPSEYNADGICGELTQWLEVNAQTYGFYRPYADDHGGIGVEPWHYSFLPSAKDIIQRFPLSTLKQVLETSDIAGASIVLAHLEAIYERYILNNQPLEAHL